MYGYANGDPLNNSDPFGLCAMCLGAAAGAALATAPLPQTINPDGYVLSNPAVRLNVMKLYVALDRESGNPGFEFRVTGGDRYQHTSTYNSANGGTRTLVEIRSRTNGSVVSGSSRTSPHLESRGARAVDLRINGVSPAIVDEAIKNSTAFSPANTARDYPDAPHTHVALPPGKPAP